MHSSVLGLLTAVTHLARDCLIAQTLLNVFGVVALRCCLVVLSLKDLRGRKWLAGVTRKDRAVVKAEW